MHPNRDFDADGFAAWNEDSLIQDLDLQPVLTAMAGDDKLIATVSRRAILGGCRNDVSTIRYRQEVLKDSLENPSAIAELSELARAAAAIARKESWGLSSRFPSSIFFTAITVLEALLESLRALRGFVDREQGRFRSPGFTALFATVRQELDPEYLGSIESQLSGLHFRRGIPLSAGLGDQNEGIDYGLRRPAEAGWWGRLFQKKVPSHTFAIAERDQAGSEILTQMHHRGIARAAVALAQSAEHVGGFFRLLATELAFYEGCSNLKSRFDSVGQGWCFPTPADPGTRCLDGEALCDVSLVLRSSGGVVGNDIAADGADFVVITGPNQGGKSTFLRGLGLAQLMMQAGMFVGAASFTAETCPELATHFKRGEDPSLKRGKFDEELARLSEIVEHLRPGAVLLFNESFASTTEREGSEVAAQIVRALLEKRVRMIYVTHLYALAHALHADMGERGLFLRAERRPDGTRTFRLLPGEPLPTSFGEDLYREVFGKDRSAADSEEPSQARSRDVAGVGADVPT